MDEERTRFTFPERLILKEAWKPKLNPQPTVNQMSISPSSVQGHFGIKTWCQAILEYKVANLHANYDAL